jgi:hypothetical protein
LGTLGLLNMATKLAANGSNISINPAYFSSRPSVFLELVEPRGPRHLLAPLLERGPPPQGGPVPSPLGIVIAPFDRQVPRKPSLLGRGQGAQCNRKYFSGKRRPLGRGTSFTTLPSPPRIRVSGEKFNLGQTPVPRGVSQFSF